MDAQDSATNQMVLGTLLQAMNTVLYLAAMAAADAGGDKEPWHVVLAQ